MNHSARAPKNTKRLVDAIERGITVSTIHCGDFATGVATGWQDGARLADGSFLNIDQTQAVADIPTPHDEELELLSGQLNATYLAYGSIQAQNRFLTNQTAQDLNATGLGRSVAATRATTKASANYRNDSRDLVDACREGCVKLEDLKDDDLPPELKKLSLDERKAYIAEKAQARGELQTKIKNLAEKREQFIADARAKQTETTEKEGLGDAVIQAAREQAKRQNYQFSK